ncbi:MAG: hypothetical protein RLZZ493_1370 [Bacteroidota bacterium]|jgi:hypothetical protein
MNWKYLLIGIIGLTACGTKQAEKTGTSALKPTLIHPLFFQDEVAAVINFPFWFNDSIIRKNNIESFELLTYGSVVDEEANEKKFPKKSVHYHFNKKGHLSYIQQTNFSEGIIISHQTFEIIESLKPPYHGVKRLNNTYGIENSSYLIIPFKYKVNVHQFDNNQKGERLHYIANEKYAGALSVDSIASPGPSDWIIIGTPERPIKRYRVKNKVSESAVTHYTYKTDNLPANTTNEDFPFTKKRSYNYGKKGIFSGYTDSTFIDNTFVTRNLNVLLYNKKGLPIGIVHKKDHVDGTANFISKEIIRYNYFKK